MQDRRFRNRYQDPDRHATGEDLACEQDLLMESILENIKTTPIGQVLSRIACLPEVRRDKILSVRRQLTEGRYDLGGRLDTVLDRVLEDLTAQP
jgi:hypothetical protein